MLGLSLDIINYITNNFMLAKDARLLRQVSKGLKTILDTPIIKNKRIQNGFIEERALLHKVVVNRNVEAPSYFDNDGNIVDAPTSYYVLLALHDITGVRYLDIVAVFLENEDNFYTLALNDGPSIRYNQTHDDIVLFDLISNITFVIMYDKSFDYYDNIFEEFSLNFLNSYVMYKLVIKIDTNYDQLKTASVNGELIFIITDDDRNTRPVNFLIDPTNEALLKLLSQGDDIHVGSQTTIDLETYTIAVTRKSGDYINQLRLTLLPAGSYQPNYVLKSLNVAK